MTALKVYIALVSNAAQCVTCRPNLRILAVTPDCAVDLTNKIGIIQLPTTSKIL